VNTSCERAISVFKRMGFDITDTVKTDIGGGFFSNDYVMERHMKWPENKEDVFEKKELNLELFDR